MTARTQWEKARLPAYASMTNPYGGVEVMWPDGEADLEDGSLFERVLSRENMARAWAQVRLLTGRSRGIALQRRIEELNRYLRGWMGYFRLSEYFRPLDGLDAWIRRRIRMCMWKQWRFPRTRIARLRAMGVPEPDAISTGSSNKGYWRLAKTKASNMAMDRQWFTELGLISIKDQWIAFHYPK